MWPAPAPPARRWRLALSLLFFALAITSKPSTVMLPVVLGLCLWWKKQWRPRHLAVPYQAGNGQIEEAVANFRAALDSDPNFPPALYNLGNALAAQGKIDEAISSYRAALRKWPVYFEARTAWAVALSRTGKFEEGITQYLEAMRIKPNDAGVHNNLGVVLGGTGAL
jgi:tetratricopeptide (TPR) repeat protein